MAMRDSFNSYGEEWYPWLFAEHTLSFESIFGFKITHKEIPAVINTDQEEPS